MLTWKGYERGLALTTVNMALLEFLYLALRNRHSRITFIIFFFKRNFSHNAHRAGSYNRQVFSTVYLILYN